MNYSNNTSQKTSDDKEGIKKRQRFGERRGMHTRELPTLPKFSRYLHCHSFSDNTGSRRSETTTSSDVSLRKGTRGKDDETIIISNAMVLPSGSRHSVTHDHNNKREGWFFFFGVKGCSRKVSETGRVERVYKN